jgi:hypothetical protein
VTTRSTVLAVWRSTLLKDAHLLYQSPPGTVALVKSFLIANDGPAATLVRLSVVSASTGLFSYAFRQPVDAGAQIYVAIWFVLEPGDQLYETSDTADVGFWISGAVLPVPG